GPGKVEHIFAQTGRLPVFAAGNSDGDIEMLNCARFKLLLNHDDAEREYFYDEGAEKALGIAKDEGYKVVSIKNDWKEIF
ncbi:MAG: HAD family hydrolase, partial [Methanobacterium sp.]